MTGVSLCSSDGLRVEPTPLARSVGGAGSGSDPSMFRDERRGVVEGLSSWVEAHGRGWHFSFPRDCHGPFPEQEGGRAWQCVTGSRACLTSRWDAALHVPHLPTQMERAASHLLSGVRSPQGLWPLGGKRWVPHPRRSGRESFLFLSSPFAHHVGF